MHNTIIHSVYRLDRGGGYQPVTVGFFLYSGVEFHQCKPVIWNAVTLV